mgnify:CR=1 FL=1
MAVIIKHWQVGQLEYSELIRFLHVETGVFEPKSRSLSRLHYPEASYRQQTCAKVPMAKPSVFWPLFLSIVHSFYTLYNVLC